MGEIIFRYTYGLVMMALAVTIGLIVPQDYWPVALLIVCSISVYRVYRYYQSNFFLISLGACATFLAMYLVVWMTNEIATAVPPEEASFGEILHLSRNA